MLRQPEYKQFFERVAKVPAERRRSELRWLFRNDLYALLRYGLNRSDMEHPWLFDRCREVQQQSDGQLDLWPRDHRKSSIITFGLSIFDILGSHGDNPVQKWKDNPECTIGLFSFSRNIAKAFLRQIMVEFESNKLLSELFPDVLFDKPKRESPKWSENDGIQVRRKLNKKEATIEAWGVVDSQPTALDVTTQVWTTNGWKQHGDLQVGDMIYGESGEPVMVIHNTGPMMGKECVEVIFKQTSIVAATDHLWAVDRSRFPRDNNGRQLAINKVVEREVVSTMDLPISGPDNRRDCNRHLPDTPSLRMSSVELPIDPYILGHWLGDGSTKQNMLTTPDAETVDAFERAGYRMEVKQDRGNYCMYYPHGLWEDLRSIGLGGAGGKFVPNEYLNNGESARRAFLQGLMDSDGGISKSGQCTFTNTREELVVAVRFLAASLAMSPGNIRKTEFSDPNHADRYEVSFMGVRGNPPFRLSRKVARLKKERYGRHHYVKGIRPVSSRLVNCIQVASVDGVYLAGEYLIPTHNSKHFDILLYDDLVTLDTVSTPDMIQKTVTSWEASLNLGTAAALKRYIGTRWHQNDPYREILKRGAAEARIHYCTQERVYPGTPVLLTEDQLFQKRKEMGPYVFAAQMLMNPRADAVNGFQREWLRYADVENSDQMNRYIVVDPASTKKRESDYTVMWVIGLNRDRNYYVLDGIRDRLSLTERIEALFSLVDAWRPMRVGYEQYGMQCDEEVMRMEMKRRNFRFDIMPLKGLDSKDARIARLVPLFEFSRIYMPTELRKVNWEGSSVDIIQQFINDEFLMWPISRYRDMLDCLARIIDKDLRASWPHGSKEPDEKEDRYARSAKNRRRKKTSWMAS